MVSGANVTSGVADMEAKINFRQEGIDVHGGFLSIKRVATPTLAPQEIN